MKFKVCGKIFLAIFYFFLAMTRTSVLVRMVANFLACQWLLTNSSSFLEKVGQLTGTQDLGKKIGYPNIWCGNLGLKPNIP